VIRCVVFSKDRPLQLDGLLRSIELHARGLYDELVVIYRASSPLFQLGYLDCKRDGVEFWRQSDDFRSDVVEAVSDARYVAFHCDDDLFYRPCPPEDVTLPYGRVVCTSLRLGTNTSYCQPLDLEQAVPVTVPWEWPQEQHDFGYPFSLDGHLYQGQAVRDLVGELGEFACPNDLEHRGVTLMQLEPEAWGPLMQAPPLSCVVSVPMNRVQDAYPNPCDNRPEWQPEVLCERFLAGERVDLEATSFEGIRGAHQVVELVIR
jgi:hypothetical protein